MLRQNKAAKVENSRWKDKGIQLAEIQIQDLNSIDNLKPIQPRFKSNLIIQSPRRGSKSGRKVKNKSSIERKLNQQKQREKQNNVNVNRFKGLSKSSVEEIPYKDCSSRSKGFDDDDKDSNYVRSKSAFDKQYVKRERNENKRESGKSRSKGRTNGGGRSPGQIQNNENFGERFELSEEEREIAQPRGPVNAEKAKNLRNSRLAKNKKRKKLSKLNQNFGAKNAKLYGSGQIPNFEKYDKLYASNYTHGSKKEVRKSDLKRLNKRPKPTLKKTDTALYKRRHTVAEIGDSDRKNSRPKPNKYLKQKSVAYSRKRKYRKPSKSNAGSRLKIPKMKPKAKSKMPRRPVVKRNRSSKRKKKNAPSSILKKQKLSKSSCFGFSSNNSEFVDPQPLAKLYQHKKPARLAIPPKSVPKSLLNGFGADFSGLEKLENKYNFLERKLRDRSRKNREAMKKDWETSKKGTRIGRQKGLKSFLENDFLKDATMEEEEGKSDLPEERPDWFRNAMRQRLGNS